MTSYAVSRGRPVPLVGKRFLVGGLCVYFAWIHALFTFILLTHNIMIMFYTGVEYLCNCVRLVLICYHPKKGKRRKLWLNVVSCKQWGGRSFNNNIYYQPSFVDISYPPDFIAPHKHILHHKKYNNRLCFMLKKQ